MLSLLIMTDARAGDPVVALQLARRVSAAGAHGFLYQSGVQPGFAATKRMVQGEEQADLRDDDQLQGARPDVERVPATRTDSTPTTPSTSYPSMSRMAVGSRRSRSRTRPGARAGADQDGGRLDQVNVTGSLIRGVQERSLRSYI